jgi:hypothetical protein
MKLTQTTILLISIFLSVTNSKYVLATHKYDAVKIYDP